MILTEWLQRNVRSLVVEPRPWTWGWCAAANSVALWYQFSNWISTLFCWNNRATTMGSDWPRSGIGFITSFNTGRYKLTKFSESVKLRVLARAKQMWFLRISWLKLPVNVIYSLMGVISYSVCASPKSVSIFARSMGIIRWSWSVQSRKYSPLKHG